VWWRSKPVCYFKAKGTSEEPSVAEQEENLIGSRKPPALIFRKTLASWITARETRADMNIGGKGHVRKGEEQ
jgi:hypothetical protein